VASGLSGSGRILDPAEVRTCMMGDQLTFPRSNALLNEVKRSGIRYLWSHEKMTRT